MSSRFNTCYLGSAEDAAEEVECLGSGSTNYDGDENDLVRVALVNALRRIARLEKAIAGMGAALAKGQSTNERQPDEK
jgi:hypothetical protein